MKKMAGAVTAEKFSQRPKSIFYFEILNLLALVLGVINSALEYERLVTTSNPIFVGIVQFFVLGILLLLILLISRKANRVALWIWVAFFFIGIIFYIPQLSGMLKNGISGIISSVQFIIEAIGIYFLFSNESRTWFKKT